MRPMFVTSQQIESGRLSKRINTVNIKEYVISAFYIDEINAELQLWDA